MEARKTVAQKKAGAFMQMSVLTWGFSSVSSFMTDVSGVRRFVLMEFLSIPNLSASISYPYVMEMFCLVMLNWRIIGD